MKFITLAIFAILATSTLQANWAVLVAGSRGWGNYRHQADVHHAQKILLKGGVPAQNIITFQYDDLANNSRNPFPGKVFNKPNGTDVYSGTTIDYAGADLTVQNYLNVLTGKETLMRGVGTGKVLKSTENDHVFLNFSDHGAPGLVAFPRERLYVKQLLDAFNTMHQKKMYKKVVYYLEACESGSMFQNLAKDINIYGLTASNERESSWGYYCGSAAVVDGKNLRTCLGDLFSIAWMEDTDVSDSTKDTLEVQHQKVKARTTKSHVTQYGDLTWLNLKTEDFLGKHNASAKNIEKPAPINEENLISSRDMQLHYLLNVHQAEMSEEQMNNLNKELLSRKRFDETFEQIREIHHRGLELAQDTDFECYDELITYYESQCELVSDYGLKYMRVLYDICYHKAEAKEAVKATIRSVC